MAVDILFSYLFYSDSEFEHYTFAYIKTIAFYFPNTNFSTKNGVGIGKSGAI